MKKRLFLSTVLFVLFIFFLISCSQNSDESPSSPSNGGGTEATPTPTLTPIFTPSPTPNGLVINASIFRDPDNANPPENCSVGILYNSTPVTNATVTVDTPDKGTLTVPQIFNTGMYTFTTSGTFSYIPGQDYTVHVYIDSTEYKQSGTAPGNITITADGSTVTWEYDGINNGESIEVVQNSTSNTTYADTGDLTSPYNIPDSAYPDSGDYTVDVKIGSYYTSFSNGAAGYLYIYDRKQQVVTK